MSIILTPDWNLFTHIGPNINLIYVDDRHLITTGSDGLFHCLNLDRECEQKLSCNLIHKAAITHLVFIRISNEVSGRDGEKEKEKDKIRIITAGSEGRVHCTDILDTSTGDGGYDRGNIKSILRTSTLIRAIEVIESMHVLIAMDSTDGRGSEVRMVAIHDIENTKNLYFDGERILEMKRGSIDKNSVWIIKSDGNTNGMIGTASLLRIDKNLKITRNIPITIIRGTRPIISIFEGLIALFNGQDIIVIKEELIDNGKEELYHVDCKTNSIINSLSWSKHRENVFLFGITKDKNLYIWQRDSLKESYKLNIPCEIICSAVAHDTTTISCIDEQGILSVIDICNNPRNKVLMEKNQNNNTKQINKEVANEKDEQKDSISISINVKGKEEEEEGKIEKKSQDVIEKEKEKSEKESEITNMKKKKKKRIIIDDFDNEKGEEEEKEKERDNGKNMIIESDKKDRTSTFLDSHRSSSPMTITKSFVNNIACWNSLGLIVITNESIDIEYNETSKRAIRFEDDRLFTLGSLSESGVILANSNCIYFVPSNEIGVLSKRQGWTLNSSISSVIIGVAIGKDYVWIAHDNGWIRMISVNGQQKIVFNPGCGGKGTCAISGNVKNNFLFIVTNNFECKVYDGAKIVANSRIGKSRILWIGFMDDSDIPMCMDLDGMLYIWPFNYGYDWIVLERISSDQPQIPISITYDLIVTVPRDARPRVTIPNSLNWKLPFLQPEDYQNQLQEAISKTHLLFEINVLNSVLTEKERKKLQNSTDKKTLELLQMAIKQEKLEKSIELSKELFGEKSIELAVQLARHNRLVQLADQIESLNNNIKSDHPKEIKETRQHSFQQAQRDISPVHEEATTTMMMTGLSPIKIETSKEKEISFPLSTSLMMKIDDSPVKKKRLLKADLGWNNDDLDETQIHPSSDNNKENTLLNSSNTNKMGFLSILSKYGKKD